MSDHLEAAAEVAAGLPIHEPPFPIPIDIVDGYRSMAAGELSETVETDDVPEVAARRGRLIIHGHAGSGKTELMHRLFQRLINEGRHATFVRLTKLAALGEAWTQLEASAPAQTALLLSDVAVPSLTETLIREAREPFFLLVDGLDEIRSSLAKSLLDALDDLAARVPNVIVIVTDRFTYRPIDPHRWTVASLRPLELSAVGNLLSRDPDQLQPLLRVPLFADLALHGQNGVHLATDDQGTMISFIRPHLAHGIDAAMLPSLADAAFQVYARNESRVFPIDQFREVAGPATTDAVIEAGVVVLDGESASFNHNLVHDYLAAVSLASDPSGWNQEGFDAVSFKAASFDVLVLIAEILADADSGEQIEVFVQQLYDWNFYAVGFVLARCVSLGSDALPSEVYTAVEAMLAERRWDLVASTAGRVEDSLRLIGDATANELLALSSLADLRAWVEAQPGSAPWFLDWRNLFLTPENQHVSVEFVSAIQDPLSIRGWTAANVVKRTDPDDAAEARLRDLATIQTDGAESVRWRASHALGAFPSHENVNTLLHALKTDPYQWTRYGAIRSLVEQAARTQDIGLRSEIVEQLIVLADEIASEPLLAGELSNCVVITKPPAGWASALRPLIAAMWARSSGQEQQLWDRTAALLEVMGKQVA